MLLIGLTGASGSGTSTAGKLLEERGYFFVDADRVYHELLASDDALRQSLAVEFGAGILTPEGVVDRKALGKIVFSDGSALLRLNALTHGKVIKKIWSLIEGSGSERAAVEAVELISSGMADKCDAVIGLVAEDSVRARRIAKRDSIPLRDAKKRIAAQKSNEYYIENCGYSLENNGSAEELREKLFGLISEIEGENARKQKETRL